MTRQEWLEATYKPGAEDNEWGNLLKEILQVFWDIFDQCRDDNVPEKNLIRLQEIDAYFLEADLERMPTLYSSALLRYSFIARPALKHWDSFLKKAVAASKARGENPRETFIGLL